MFLLDILKMRHSLIMALKHQPQAQPDQQRSRNFMGQAINFFTTP